MQELNDPIAALSVPGTGAHLSSILVQQAAVALCKGTAEFERPPAAGSRGNVVGTSTQSGVSGGDSTTGPPRSGTAVRGTPGVYGRSYFNIFATLSFVTRSRPV